MRGKRVKQLKKEYLQMEFTAEDLSTRDNRKMIKTDRHQISHFRSFKKKYKSEQGATDQPKLKAERNPMDQKAKEKLFLPRRNRFRQPKKSKQNLSI
jgi:hypothetical protein